MTVLRKTGQRLALLQAVADGAVHRCYPILPSKDYDEWDHGPRSNIYSGHSRRYQRVNARVQELRAAELVELLPRQDGDGYKANRRYRLTSAGEALLREWGGTP